MSVHPDDLSWSRPRSHRAFVAFLVTTLVLYIASALFADAGTHGWDSLKLFPG